MNKMILLLAVTSLPVQAEWLCRSQASKVETDDTVLACGVATSVKESIARVAAREAAFEEFRALNHANRDYRIEPLRTECVERSSGSVCYRAFRFHLGGVKRLHQLDRNELERELTQRRSRLRMLERRYSDLRERENNLVLLEKTEARIMELENKLADEDYMWKDHNKSYTVRLGVGHLSLNEGYTSLYLGVERKLGRYVGVGLNGRTVGGSDGSSGAGIGLETRLYGWRGLNLSVGYNAAKVSSSTRELACRNAGACATYEEVTTDTDLSGLQYGVGWTSRSLNKGLAWEIQLSKQETSTGSGLEVRAGLGFGF